MSDRNLRRIHTLFGLLKTDLILQKGLHTTVIFKVICTVLGLLVVLVRIGVRRGWQAGCATLIWLHLLVKHALLTPQIVQNFLSRNWSWPHRSLTVIIWTNYARRSYKPCSTRSVRASQQKLGWSETCPRIIHQFVSIISPCRLIIERKHHQRRCRHHHLLLLNLPLARVGNLTPSTQTGRLFESFEAWRWLIVGQVAYSCHILATLLVVGAGARQTRIILRKLQEVVTARSVISCLQMVCWRRLLSQNDEGWVRRLLRTWITLDPRLWSRLFVRGQQKVQIIVWGTLHWTRIYAFFLVVNFGALRFSARNWRLDHLQSRSLTSHSFGLFEQKLAIFAGNLRRSTVKEKGQVGTLLDTLRTTIPTTTSLTSFIFQLCVIFGTLKHLKHLFHLFRRHSSIFERTRTRIASLGRRLNLFLDLALTLTLTSHTQLVHCVIWVVTGDQTWRVIIIVARIFSILDHSTFGNNAFVESFATICYQSTTSWIFAQICSSLHSILFTLLLSIITSTKTCIINIVLCLAV